MRKVDHGNSIGRKTASIGRRFGYWQKEKKETKALLVMA